MKKYGDDADQFHNQGTRIEESKKWHEQNQLRHDYSYRSVSKPKSTYKPKTSNKSTYKPDYSKTYYKPNYSNKTNRQNRKKQFKTTSYKSYNNQGYKQRTSRSKSTSNSSSKDSSAGDFACVIGILVWFLFAIFIHSFDNYVGFYTFGPLTYLGIMIGVFVGIGTFILVDDVLSKSKIKSSRSEYTSKYESTLDWKICPKCGRKYDKNIIKCSYCGYNFK